MLTFNDTTTHQGLVQALRDRTGQTNLSIEKATRAINFALDEYTSLAMKSGQLFDDSTLDTDMYTDISLTASQEYIDISSFLAVDRIEVYDGVKWTRLSIPEYDEGVLREMYNADGQPLYYTLKGNRAYLYPNPNGSFITARVYFLRKAQHFAIDDEDETIGIPEIHQEYIVVGASYRIMQSTNDPSLPVLRDEMYRQEQKVKDFWSSRDNTVPRLVPKLNIGE